MNYFLSNLFRDKMLWGAFGLAALSGLIIIDFITFMLTPRAVFDLWPLKITVGAAIVGTVIYGLLLRKREKRDKRLEEILPGFLKERMAFLAEKTAENPEFQTLCHQCRHFDLVRLGCLLVLGERKVRIRLNDESRVTHCLYWNLDDMHPVVQLTRRLKTGKAADSSF